MQPIRYMTSLLTFYLKGEIQQERNFVNLKMPNTIFNLIPLGSKKESIPVTQLATVESDFKMHFGAFLSGLIFVILGLFLFSVELWPIALFMLIVGANRVLAAFETILVIKTTAGDMKYISFFVFEKSKADQAEKEIRTIISNRLDDTNARMQTNRIVNAINGTGDQM
ncbi:MAG: hypothetical protein IJY50_09220 [Clostridia bacterium]|nr:hypothetical protein [Clostridia bacterium]